MPFTAVSHCDVACLQEMLLAAPAASVMFGFLATASIFLCQLYSM